MSGHKTNRKNNCSIFNSRLSKTLVFGLCFILLIILFFPSPLSAQESYDDYAPIFYFEANEELFPIPVEYHIENAILYEFTNDDITLIDDSIDATKLKDYNLENHQNYFLDNTIGTIEGNKIITHYKEQKANFNYTVYTKTFDITSDLTVVQYWLFYAFNKGDLNQHEGDWELVQIEFQNNKPTNVMYSQHHSGQQATWSQIEKTDTHPHVYVSRGSHANYMKSYSGVLGIASDHVGANGLVLTPEQYTLVPLQDQGWLEFRGMWGEINGQEDKILGQSGPNGPKYRADGLMWNDPIGWGASLAPLDQTVLIFEWILYNFVLIFVIILIISLSFFSIKKLKQYKNQGFGSRYFSFLYIDGLNMKSVGNILFITGLIIAIVALFQPWYLVSATINTEQYSSQGMIDIISIDGLQGISVNLPNSNGSIPLGSAFIPFSIVIGIGLILTVANTLGVQTSKKLGKSYLSQGIKLIIPIIFIIVGIIAISMLSTSLVDKEMDNSEISSIFGDIASAPFGGSTQKSIISEEQQIQLQWGLQNGGFLLFISGIICVIGGILERNASKEFF